MTIFGVLGLIIISAAIWVKEERKQDYLFILGGIALLMYSYSIQNWIFILLQIVFILSALLEMIKNENTKH